MKDIGWTEGGLLSIDSTLERYLRSASQHKEKISPTVLVTALQALWPDRSISACYKPAATSLLL